jgi:hypothetical protein
MSDRLNTATARQMAEERFAFMVAFVTQVHRELTNQDPIS